MKHARPLLLAASTLVLFITACSQPADIQASVLEPQFGSAAGDIGVDVAVTSASGIYAFGQQSAVVEWEGTDYSLQLRRYDSSGKLVWNRQVDTRTCPEWDSNCIGLFARAVEVDANGFIYAVATYEGVADDNAYSTGYNVYKLDANGTVLSDTLVGITGSGLGDDYKANNFLSVAVSKDGSIYVAKRQFDYDFSQASGTHQNLVSKFSTSGALLWQRPSMVGTPKGVTVSPSGSVYVVGTKGLARYTNSGDLTWTKPGNFEEVMVSGSNLYTRYRKDVRKLDGSGKQLWLKPQGGLDTMVFQDMTGDSSGNVYLSGKYQASTGNMNAVIRKLNSSGSVLWTRTYGTGAYDDARGVATVNGSEVYTTGETQGSLAHPNLGGPHNRDGYLRKLSSSGNSLWTR